MKARGVEFDDGNFIKKAKARAPVIMPLLLNSMDRSMEIAEAMEARGFGAGKRTRYFDSPLTLRDKALIATFVAAIPFGVPCTCSDMVTLTTSLARRSQRRTWTS